MKTIHKYPLDPRRPIVEMPIGAKVLSVQIQRGDVCLWALVDTSAEIERRAFIVLGTGHEVPDNDGEFVATFQMEDLGLVFHVFETAPASLSTRAR